MPYMIVEKDNQFCVYKHDEEDKPTGESLGCHPSRKEAEDQMAALYIHAEKSFAVKAVGDWELEVLVVPFGGPSYGKDSDGEFFSTKTDIAEKQFISPLVTYYHGLEPDGNLQGKPEIIGAIKEGSLVKKSDGWWVNVILDKVSEYAKRVWEAAKQGIAKASSGSISHLIRKSEDGEILNWPLAEIALFDAEGDRQPANQFAVALPVMKALYEKSGNKFPVLPEESEPESEAIGDEQRAKEVQTIKPVASSKSSKKEPNMADETQVTVAEADLTAMKAQLDAQSAELKAIKAALPTVNGGGSTVEVTKDPADVPFTSIAEQCRAVKAFTLTTGRQESPRLKYLAAKGISGTGASENVPSEGGFLLEPTLTPGVLKPIHEAGPFVPGTNKLPVSSNSNSGWLNGVDETSRATGSRWGGVQGYRLAEGGTPTASKPKFRRINWELKKYAALVYGTDELLADTTQFNAVVQQACTEELGFMANDDVFRGMGTGGPTGMMNSPCLVSVAKETSQTADTILYENIVKMWARMLVTSKPRSTWFINGECSQQLDSLALIAGTSAIPPYYVTIGTDGVTRIKGRPVVETEFNAALGDKGDILLADMSEYLFWEKAGIDSAASIHVAFLSDETVFRFLYRCDGQTVRASALTPYKGGSTLSSFVTLDERA